MESLNVSYTVSIPANYYLVPNINDIMNATDRCFS